MTLILRKIQHRIKQTLKRGKSILLLGPRQTGKTTLMKELQADLYLNLANPKNRIAFDADPARLTREVEALYDEQNHVPFIIIDEVQKVPSLLDAVQDLIDEKKGQFILTGSSARKLRRDGEANLLPGRVIVMRMDPLMLQEMPQIPSIEDLLIDGSLPGIVMQSSPELRQEDLFSYVTTYLEEEVRAEALTRHIGPFSQFLKLAALESGTNTHLQSLSQQVGVTHHIIAEYFQILVDCLVAERIHPLSTSRTRKRLLKSPKYLLYDLGVRRVAAGEGRQFPDKYFGNLFEQWVGLEISRTLRLHPEKSELMFWRDANGPEVDWIVERGGMYIPIEVKWSENPSPKDAKHLNTFLNEYENTTMGYVICRTPRKQKLADRILALPWQEIHNVFLTK
ncbi:MAG: ATP-binding protein [Chlamydiia bacterium]|nr:ATP-binding protein [Chlamydiia bacterium]